MMKAYKKRYTFERGKWSTGNVATKPWQSHTYTMLKLLYMFINGSVIGTYKFSSMGNILILFTSYTRSYINTGDSIYYIFAHPPSFLTNNCLYIRNRVLLARPGLFLKHFKMWGCEFYYNDSYLQCSHWPSPSNWWALCASHVWAVHIYIRVFYVLYKIYFNLYIVLSKYLLCPYYMV